MKLKGVVLSVFSFAVLFSGILFASGGIMPGSGTQADPYRIEDLADFQAFCGNSAYWAAGVYTQLDADIDLSVVGTYTTSLIGRSSSNSFAGNFNGHTHTISNLTIGGTSYLGLFGYIGSGGAVYDLGLENISVTGTGDYIGGLVGYNYGQVSRCYVSGSVSGRNFVGGVCGDNNQGTIIDCYATGTVGGNEYVGGLNGWNHSGTITTCYSLCFVSGTSNVGGFCGGGSSVNSCYYYNYFGWKNGYGTGLTSAQLQNSASLVGFNFATPWATTTGNYPKLQWQTFDGPSLLGTLVDTTLSGIGSEADPFLIATRDDLIEFHNNTALRSGFYELMADIDLSGDSYIGAFISQRFSGMFDGNGHTISGLTVAGGNNIGFFSAQDGLVKDLGLEDVSVTGTGDYVAGLVGLNYGQISRCYVSGSIEGRNFVGGVCGDNYGGSIIDCYATGTVSGTQYVGGLNGWNHSGTITTCYSLCFVSGTSNVGGFCGGGSSVNSCYYYNYFGWKNGFGTPLTSSALQNPASLIGFNFAAPWAITAGNYPKLQWQTFDGPPLLSSLVETTLSGSGSETDPYIIATRNDLIEFHNNSALRSGFYKLMADVDLSGDSYIGAFISQRFSGLFDGNGHTISGLTVAGGSYVGLFSQMDGVIKDLGLNNTSVTGTGDDIGGLVGCNYGQVSRCYVSGSVSGRNFVGGVCGDNNQGTIIDCYATGTVSGNEYVGGLSGYNRSAITTCYSLCFVSGTSSVGGFCGAGSSVNYSYWNVETDGIDGNASGSNNCGAIGKTTSEMHLTSTYVGWEFASEIGSINNWYMFAGEYPCLIWEVAVVPEVINDPYINAETEITESRLSVGTVSHEYSFTVTQNNVINQSIAAGQYVLRGTALGLTVSDGPEMTTVPDVVNMAQANAETALTNAKLIAGVTHSYSFTVPAGHVISQSIVAGTSIIINRVVDIVISDGPEMTLVPNVAGLTETQAISALMAAKLAVGTITHQYDFVVPSGDVISQGVAAGTSVMITTTVNIIVSDGPEMVGVPSLYDKHQVEAQALIMMNNLTVGTISYAYSFTVAQGNVLAQSVAGGGSAVIGSPINLVLSQGPQIVTVPSLSGKTQAQAQSEIVSAGLLVGTVTQHYSPTIANGIVMVQSSQAGSSILIGSFINLVVSKGPEMTTVPSVVGLSQAYAEATLRAADLAVGTITTAYSFTVPAGNVISQSRAGGQSVPVDTAVNLIISNGPEMTTVPNVVNMTEANAGAALATAKLAVGAKTSAHSLTVPAGSIISQAIAAGQSVVINTVVNLVVSDGSMVSVPNVVNMEQALAGSALTSASLIVGTVTTDYSATVPAGYVISMSIEAGQSVVFNTAVNLVVSSGIEMVAVPNIANKTQAQAQSALLSAGLAIGNVTLEKSFTVAQDSVISQAIAEGEIVAAGTAIDMVVSNGSDFIDMLVFAQLAQYWQNTGCSQGYNCDRVDFNTDGVIDAEDLLLLSESWLSSDGILVPSVIADYFETGDFDRLDWQFGGEGDWTIAENELYRGKYTAKSGAAGNNQSSEMTLTVDTTGFDTIRFACKTSSEADYDYLYFYIDGKRKGSFSGQTNWSINSYSLTPGVHTFKWSYIKDETMNDGSDCAWIDDVVIYKAQ